jgi:uncharacterized BrkB/YihY/UPF0761 family membrane protein
MYLSHSVVGVVFGTPGALMIVLVWISWCTQLVCFGAELTWVYATRYGSRIVPTDGAHTIRCGRSAWPGHAQDVEGTDGEAQQAGGHRS